MNLFKKATAVVALVTLLSGMFTTGVSAYSTAQYDAAKALAADGIIVSHDTAAGFNLDQMVLRQEIAAVARGVAGLSKKTTCDNVFADVTATTPNTWACYSVEALADADLIAKNANFNPETNITKAEAVGMMVKAAGLDYAYDASNSASWMEQVVAFAVENDVVSNFTDYNTSATRGFVFDAAVSAMDSDSDDEDLLDDLLGNLGDDEDEEDDTTEDDTTDDVIVSAGSELMVTLSANTPAAQNVPKNAKNVEFMSFDVTAGNVDSTLKTIKLQRVDLGSRTDFDKVWLTQDGVVVSNDKSISSDDMVNITLNHTMKAGSTETFTVNASFTATTPASVVNAFKLVSIEANTSVEMGSVRGNSMTTVAYTVAKVTLTAKGSDSTIDAGEEMETIGEFKLAETATSKKGVIVKSIRFKASGGVDLTENLANIALYEGSTQLSTATIIDGDYVTFKLGSLLIEDAKSKTLAIKADVVSGDDTDSLTLTVKDDFDIYAIEEGTSIGSDVDKGTALATYTLNAGKVTLSRDTSTPSSEEYIADSDDILAFVAKVDTDQAVLVDSLRLFVTDDSTVSGGTTKAAIDAEIENVRVFVNETLIDSVDTITQVNVDVLDGASYYDFDSSFELKDNDLIKVYLDLTNSAAVGTTVSFNLNTSTSLIDVEYVSDGETVAAAKLTGSATSNNVEVVNSAAGTSIVRNDGYASETFLAGQQQTVLKQFVVNAGNSSSLEIRKMRFNAVVAGVTAVAQVDTLTLTGTSGTAAVTTAGVAGSPLTATFNTDLTTTAADFVTANAAAYATAGITLTSAGADLILTAAVAGTGHTSPSIANATGDLAGANVATTANVAAVAANSSDKFKNFKLLRNGSQVGGTEDLNASLFVTIDDINVTIAKGGQETFQLVGDIDTSAETGTIALTLDGSDANGDSVYYDVNDNEITFADEGSVDTSNVKDNAILAAAVDGDTPDSALVLANTTGVEIAKYKFTATDGDVNIKDLYFKNITTGADARIAALKLVVNGSIVDSRVPSSDVVRFNLGSTNKIKVLKNEDLVVTVVADFNKITSAAQTNKIITLELTDIVADTAATSKELALVNGAAINDGDHYTTSTLSAADIQGEAMYIRKTQPTVAVKDLGTTKLANGEQTIFKITVSADSAAGLEVAAIDFDVTTGSPSTSGFTVGTYKLFVNGTDKTSDGAFTGDKFAFGTNKNSVVSAGTSKTYELKATLAGVVSDDYVSVKIVEDAAAAAAANKATAVAASIFTWSDTAGSPHTEATLDYFNGNNVNGLDTTTTTLTN